MPVRYLLDTNMASYIIKGNIPRVRERLLKAPMAQVAISVVTEAELRYGVARTPEALRLGIAVDEFLLRVESLPWDSGAARQYARVRAVLTRRGETMGNLDVMIAAHALSVQAVLVTHDQAFHRIEHLRTEDWARP